MFKTCGGELWEQQPRSDGDDKVDNRVSGNDYGYGTPQVSLRCEVRADF